MKLKSLHILLAALAFTWSVLAGAQQTPDSASFAALGAKLDSYMEAMAPLSVQEQEKECSFLIVSGFSCASICCAEAVLLLHQFGRDGSRGRGHRYSGQLVL